MNKDFKYQNNYAWPGTTAILYKIVLENYFQKEEDGGYFPDIPVLPEYINKITNIGIEWKESSASTWNIQSLNYTVEYINYSRNLHLDEDLGNIYCGYLRAYNGKKLFPLHCCIKNLTPNTAYDIRSYITIDGITTYFNEQNISTLSDLATVGEIIYNHASTTTEEEKIELTNTINSMLSIYTMFFSDFTLNLNVGTSETTPGAANMNGYIGDNLSDYPTMMWSTRFSNLTHVDIAIHELAHYLLRRDNYYSSTVLSKFYNNDVIKFMEFATDVPYASWKWMGHHNYPIISSADYDYIGNCLVMAACQMSQVIEKYKQEEE